MRSSVPSLESNSEVPPPVDPDITRITREESNAPNDDDTARETRSIGEEREQKTSMVDSVGHYCAPPHTAQDHVPPILQLTSTGAPQWRMLPDAPTTFETQSRYSTVVDSRSSRAKNERVATGKTRRSRVLLEPQPVKKCHNCETTFTSQWRSDGVNRLCNKCGLYWERKGKMRPGPFDTTIKRRKRRKNADTEQTENGSHSRYGSSSSSSSSSYGGSSGGSNSSSSSGLGSVGGNSITAPRVTDSVQPSPGKRQRVRMEKSVTPPPDATAPVVSLPISANPNPPFSLSTSPSVVLPMIRESAELDSSHGAEQLPTLEPLHIPSLPTVGNTARVLTSDMSTMHRMTTDLMSTLPHPWHLYQQFQQSLSMFSNLTRESAEESQVVIALSRDEYRVASHALQRYASHHAPSQLCPEPVRIHTHADTVQQLQEQQKQPEERQASTS